MDDVLKQFLFDLYAVGQEMQKKPPDNIQINLTYPSEKKGSDPASPNYQVR